MAPVLVEHAAEAPASTGRRVFIGFACLKYQDVETDCECWTEGRQAPVSGHQKGPGRVRKGQRAGERSHEKYGE